MKSPIDIALAVGRACESVGLRYILGGSLASTIAGEPRATLDVDFVIDLDASSIRAWIDALGHGFSVDEDWVRDELRRRGSFQALHLETMTRVDVFVPEWSGVDLWKWETRERITFDDGSAIDVTSPAGIVVQKLRWFRGGGETSEQQWRDVLGVMKARRKDLDVGSLHSWCARLGLTDLLGRALSEAGIPQP